MSKSPSRRFPVTVTQLPVTRCQICRRTVADLPGNLTEVLTEHYRRAHPEALDPCIPVTAARPRWDVRPYWPGSCPVPESRAMMPR